MRSSSDADLKTDELEKRLARLERSPAGGGLSQQEQARLEREFGRLEAEIRDVAGKMPSGPSSLMVGVLVIVALVLGLGAGFGISSFRPSSPSAAKSGDTPSAINLREPEDMKRFLGYQTTDQGVVLRYSNSQGETKAAVYRYEDQGEPSVIFKIPKDTGASNLPASGDSGNAPASARELSGNARKSKRTSN
jgi:hypothetical protein